MKRLIALPLALLITSCQQRAIDQGDIGRNPPPIEFQAACLVLPRGAVVSLTHTPTLGVVLRTMSLKEHMTARWEKVSDTSYIQRIEGSDPLTGKATAVGIMFTQISTTASEGCPNGRVQLARMVINDKELSQSVMNDAFVSMVNVTALNGQSSQPMPQSQPSAPPPTEEIEPTGMDNNFDPQSDLNVCLNQSTTDEARVACYDDEIENTLRLVKFDALATDEEIASFRGRMNSCPSSIGALAERECKQRMAQDFNIAMLTRAGRD